MSPSNNLVGMRPKLVSLLAVSALALVGCSAAEPAPTTTPAPTATETLNATPSESAEAESSQEADGDEEAFLAQLTFIRDAKEDLSGDLKKKTSETYQLERGEEYCELLEKDPMTEPRYKDGTDATDLQIESNILMAAKLHLCPSATN